MEGFLGDSCARPRERTHAQFLLLTQGECTSARARCVSEEAASRFMAACARGFSRVCLCVCMHVFYSYDKFL